MTNDRELAGQLAAKCNAAVLRIRERMDAHGLRGSDGWTISETTREVASGSEIVFHPLHITRTPSVRLECVVKIDEATGSIEHECRCDAAPQ